MAAVDTSPRLKPSSEGLLGMMSLAHMPVLDTMTPDQRSTAMCFAREMYRIGTEVERQRAQRGTRAAADRPRAGAPTRRQRALWLALELAASFTTLAGMALGSTTVAGASWYLVSAGAWIWLSVERRLWGLMPLNAAALLIEILNFLRASG